MRLWIMPEDKAEHTTTIKEYFLARPEVAPFISEQKSYYSRNNVKIKIKKFKLGE